jgi:hypothetical protein
MARFSRAKSLHVLSLGLAVLGTIVVGIGWMPARAAPVLAVSVSGNHLLDGNGQVVVLHGVNRPSTVYACIQGWGIFDGPSDDASVLAIANWKTNAVRLQLNEDCWLNINMGTSTFGGAVYVKAIQDYVNLLHAHGLYAILSLAWNAPGTTPATAQQVMADADHAPAFWSSLASAFKSDPAVLFDLYNETHDISWDCWRDGTGCPAGGPWVGFQSLVTTVRNTGATQPILLSGNAWGADLRQWLQYKPSDPANGLVASFHVYGPTWSGCVTFACWDLSVKPVAQQVPVVTGEMGENDCMHSFIDPYMAWADVNGVSYLGFSWEGWANGCTAPSLITAYDGTPTRFGVGLRDHLATLARGLSIAVSGTRLIDGGGRQVVLHGVNRPALLFPCIQGWGIFDGPNDSSSVTAIASWHANVVRLPLNEDCWLNINGVKPAFAGAAYQKALSDYVNLLHQGGLYVILSLAWNAPGTTPSTGQQVMADADHAPAFWQSVATAFRSDPAVLFDLYNEPHDISWACWRYGCTTTDGWQTAGMESLINVVRSAGATQPILVGGLGWANDLGGWLANQPTDQSLATVASFNEYDQAACRAQSCWTGVILPIAQRVPLVTGELREFDCTHAFIDPYMAWADANGISYVGSAWSAWANACASASTLITAYDGTPTNFGVGLRDHLAAIAQ